MKTFLRFQPRRHHDHGTPGKFLPQQRDHEGLGRRMDAVERQCSTMLHAPQQVLHGGSVGGLGKDV